MEEVKIDNIILENSKVNGNMYKNYIIDKFVIEDDTVYIYFKDTNKNTPNDEITPMITVSKDKLKKFLFSIIGS